MIPAQKLNIRGKIVLFLLKIMPYYLREPFKKLIGITQYCIWSDDFKKYNNENYAKIPKELSSLKLGMDDHSQLIIDRIWERYTRIIPMLEYADKIKIAPELLISEDELEEQTKIRQEMGRIIRRYKLPGYYLHEVSVFYYHNGLAALNEKCGDYIKGKDFIDCGAYVGDSVLMMDMYKPSKIFALELSRENYNTMINVIDSNKKLIACEIIPLNCGVGAYAKKTDLIGKDSSVTASKKTETSCEGANCIDIYPLDLLVAMHKMTPGFIKMDIEGSEFNAILGAEQSIKKFRPVLSISIYHTPKDFFKIKPLIESWHCRYVFRVEKYNPFAPTNETVLMAIPEELSI